MQSASSEDRRAKRGITVNLAPDKVAPFLNGRVFDVSKNGKPIGSVIVRAYYDEPKGNVPEVTRLFIETPDASRLTLNGIDVRVAREVESDTINGVTRWRYGWDSSDRGAVFGADLPAGVRSALADLTNAIEDHFEGDETWKEAARIFDLAERLRRARQGAEDKYLEWQSARKAANDAEARLRATATDTSEASVERLLKRV